MKLFDVRNQLNRQALAPNLSWFFTGNQENSSRLTFAASANSTPIFRREFPPNIPAGDRPIRSFWPLTALQAEVVVCDAKGQVLGYGPPMTSVP
jgi:hypothetical protein